MPQPFTAIIPARALDVSWLRPHAMKIVSYMVAAFQQFMPGVDVGIDLSKEYAAVKGG